MLSAFVLSLVSTLVLTLVAGVASGARNFLRASVRGRVGKLEIPGPQSRLLTSMILFGIFAGCGASLGLIPGPTFLPLAGMVAVMTGRRIAAGSRGSDGFDRDVWWFVVVSWSSITASIAMKTFSTSGVVATQAVLGPAAIAYGPFVALGLGSSWLSGVMAASFWVQRLEQIPLTSTAEPSADEVLHWGETALAASAVSVPIMGPSLGALIHGPLDLTALAGVAFSLVFTCGSVSLAGFLRGYVKNARAILVFRALLIASAVCLLIAATT